jgi:hypothetical protein
VGSLLGNFVGVEEGILVGSALGSSIFAGSSLGCMVRTGSLVVFAMTRLLAAVSDPCYCCFHFGICRHDDALECGADSKALDISCRNRHPRLLFDPLFLLYNVIRLVVGLAVRGMLKVVVCCFDVGNNSFGV